MGQKKSCPAGANLPLWTNALPPLKLLKNLIYPYRKKSWSRLCLNDWPDYWQDIYLRKIYIFYTDFFCIQEILEMNVKIRFLSAKLPFEFVFSCCEFTNHILIVKKQLVWMFVLKLSGKQMIMRTHNRTLYMWSFLIWNE